MGRKQRVSWWAWNNDICWRPCTRSQVSSMSSVMVAGACGKLRQKMSASAAVIRAASMRDGMFSIRLMVGCEQRS
jgi:hypothetical protein